MQDGLHGGPPLYHISVMYELFPVGPGDGGFGCVAGSHLPGARIGPDRSSPLGAGHVPWGRPPWTPEVDRCVTRVEGQPWQAIIFTERLVHTTLPWTGRGEVSLLGVPPHARHEDMINIAWTVATKNTTSSDLDGVHDCLGSMFPKA